ncbi:MAG: GTPase Era, partial [Omnitrophica WOR_2 bacterium RIFCSPHIGHO2_01_FULL_48_9]
RNRIRGIYNDERGQIIFIDTPGLVLGRDSLDKLLKKASFGTVEEADCIVHLVDSSEPTGLEERNIVERLSKVKAPVIVGLNKIDLKGKHVSAYIELWEHIKGKPIQEIKNLILLPLSGERKTNVEKLIDLLFDCLKEGPALYPKDIVCDIPKKIVIADIIREKFLNIVRQEVPHSLTVVVESIEPRRGKVLYIRAVVLVERDSQKEIVIGKAGHVLKEVGTLARQELEELLERKIFLETHVKAQKDWRDDVSLLQELGYDQ